MQDEFRFGIEEEYFLVEAETKAIARKVPKALFAAVKALTRGRGKGEFLQQQLEVVTKPHVDMTEAQEELRQLRNMLAAIVAPYGLVILAAGTPRQDESTSDQGRTVRCRHA
jgi:carboxylate-amine ligase